MPAMKSVHDLQVDDVFESVGTTVVVLGDIHHKIHEGDYHMGEIIFASKDSGTVCEALFRTPDSAISCHCTVKVDTIGAANFQMREGVTVTASGTVVTAYNAQRSGGNAATAVIRSSPTLAASGTVLPVSLRTGGGEKKSAFGDIGSSREEFILKNDTDYALRITSWADGNEMIVTVGWYEV